VEQAGYRRSHVYGLGLSSEGWPVEVGDVTTSTVLPPAVPKATGYLRLQVSGLAGYPVKDDRRISWFPRVAKEGD